MHLVRVERFFSGSKMIFYFTADSRVDFRALVKDLVQEFRTRVEMRQVGVRHETKMIGGIGTCGRELCCSSYIKNFDSVSIKMAKEQDLPLNPTKISGVCNRLLCCLTYEYETYKKQRKNMPKAGKRIKLEGDQYLVKRQMPLQDAVIAENSAGEDVMLKKEQWELSQPFLKDTPEKKKEKKKSK
jgi:cell fate regulator YaaT (PSP1 superfamily)